MKKTIIISIFYFIKVSAQVGINTTTPAAALDVTSTINGVLFPRIELTANNIEAPVVNPQGGGLVTSTTIYNTATVSGINGVSPGYYYWTGTLWSPIAGSASNDWKLFGNTSITEPITPLSYGTTTIGLTENFIGTTDNNDLVLGTKLTERMRIKKGSGNIGVGTANPLNKLHVSTTAAGLTSTLSENTFAGNTNGIGILGSSVNNPGFGVGGQFFGGSFGIQSTANATTFSGTATGISGISTGSGGAIATRIGGSFASNGANATNYGGRFTATGASTNYGADFIASGVATANYGASFTVSGGTTGNWAGLFKATGGVTATGADFIANNGTNETTGGYFQANGTTINYGIRTDVYGIGATTNYAGNFYSNGGTNNFAGYFVATGGTNNYAIVVPNASGKVGIGTSSPTTLMHISSPTSGALRIVDGTEANGKVLTSNATGIATWQKLGIDNAVATLSTTGVNVPYNTLNYLQTGTSITIPPGKYAVNVNMILGKSSFLLSPNNSFFWVRSSFSESSTVNPTPSSDIIGSNLVSGNYPGTCRFTMLNGTIVINNTTAANKIYYYIAGNCYADFTTETITGFGASVWAENNIVAYRLN